MSYLENLNPEQIEAVKTVDKPLRIIAGAGSGKTRIICSKILYLINDCGIFQNNILAITFTNKACREIKNRIEVAINSKVKNIHTFHSLGLKILRSEAHHLGLTSDFSIIDSDEQKKFLKDIIKKEDPIGLDLRFEDEMIKQFSNWKQEECLKGFNENVPADLENNYNIYKIYKEKLIENNLVDFDDLLVMPIKLFEKNREIKKCWAEKFQYFLIDEYQDTNKIQDILINMLIDKRPNFTVVGDPDQNIYSWRGADLSLILDFEEQRNNAKTIYLERNYRSKQQILDVANDLIAKNKARLEKKLYSQIEDGQKVKFTSFDSRPKEATYVAEKIKTLVNKGLFKYSDFFILYRNNSWSTDLEMKLTHNSIPFVIYNSKALSERKVVKDLIAIMRCLIIKDKSDLYWSRFLNLLPNVAERSVLNLKKRADESNLSYYDFFAQQKEEALEVNKGFKPVIQAIEKMDELLSKDLKMKDFMDILIDLFDYRSSFTPKEEFANLELIKLFLEQIDIFDQEINKEVSNLYDKFSQFLQENALQTQDKYSADEDKVIMSTIHGVKGLEAKYVFLCGFLDEIIPGKSIDPVRFEEERRLVYVAITRAKNVFEFTHVANFSLYNKPLSGNVSRFLNDINTNLIEFTNKPSPINNLRHEFSWGERYKNNSSIIRKEVNVNDIIEHTFFGEGIVLEVDRNMMKVSFKNGQIKSISVQTNVWINKSNKL